MTDYEQRKHCRKEHGKEVFRWMGLCKECWYKFKWCNRCWAGNGDGTHDPQNHITPFQFKRLYVCDWDPMCDTKDANGNHCPEPPTHTINDGNQTITLCDKCYKRFKNQTTSTRQT